MRGFFFLLAFWLPAALAVAQPAGTAWLAEGKVFLVRGATLHTVADGVKVQEGDILATEAKSQVQVQFNDGSLVNAGPGTQLMVVGAKGSPELALSAGWLKIAQKPGQKNLRVWTPAAQLAFDETTAVVRSAQGALQAFVESGALAVTEAAEKPGAAAAPRRVKAGEFYSFSKAQRTVQPRPAKDFIDSMPRHYRDPLPALPDKVKDRKVEPRREREVTYEDVGDWLKTSMPVRKGFVKRFLPRLGDPQFRAGLAAHVREHPEWDRILFPEKYEPKDPPAGEKGSGDVKPKQASGGKP